MDQNNLQKDQSVITEGTEEVMIIEESEEEITIDNEHEQPYLVDASRGSFPPESHQALHSPIDKTSSTMKDIMRDFKATNAQGQHLN